MYPSGDCMSLACCCGCCCCSRGCCCCARSCCCWVGPGARGHTLGWVPLRGRSYTSLHPHEDLASMPPWKSAYCLELQEAWLQSGPFILLLLSKGLVETPPAELFEGIYKARWGEGGEAGLHCDSPLNYFIRCLTAVSHIRYSPRISQFVLLGVDERPCGIRSQTSLRQARAHLQYG